MDDPPLESEEDLPFNISDHCKYCGTDQIHVKIYLIGVAATLIAILSIAFNTFFTVVFIRNRSIRKSAVFYFGILAIIDTIMGINYLAVMSFPVYMDYYKSLPMYHLFLSYFRVVLTESNCAMFASMLLILLATTERLLRTFENNFVRRCRKYLEKNRALVSCICIVVAIAYRICGYWEIDVIWKPECEQEDIWGQYEIVSGPLAQNSIYKLYWMFWTRNIVERILPFFLLVAMNYLIMKALKQDYKRYGDGKPEVHIRVNGQPSTKANRGSLRDATRALISMVTMYLMSQTLQVTLTFWETFYRESLDQIEVIYSYLNDIVSIMALLSSCLRFPVYCSCNRLIFNASRTTVRQFLGIFCRSIKPRVYQPIQTRTTDIDTVEEHIDESEKLSALGAVFNDKLQEWQL